MFTQKEFGGSEIVFCVEFDWGGRTHRYSTESLQLSSENIVYNFNPGILEFDFTESIEFSSTEIESNVVMMNLKMDDINLLERWAQGDSLEGLNAEFFYVLTKYGRSLVSYEERVILYRGQIQEPTFGDPNEIEGIVAISIEAIPYDSDRLLLDSNKYIDDRFHHRDLDTSDGKPYPILIGDGGGQIFVTAGSTKSIFGAPAYCVHRYDSHDDCRMMLSDGIITASSATIQDDNFKSASKTVLTDTDGRGNFYSYIELKTSDNVAMPNYSGSGDSRSWWFYVTGGGGIENPYGEGYLSKAGDLCRWALSRSGQNVDDDSWAGLSPFLNQYNFSGYINDDGVSAFEWLQGNILPFLPISIRMGPKGLRPVLLELWALGEVASRANIEIGDNKPFIQVGAIETQKTTADIVNRYTLKWAKRGYDQGFSSQIRVTNIETETYDILSDYSITSINRFGTKPQTEEASYIYDRTTAQKVAIDKVRANAFPTYLINLESSLEMGWLEVGDIVTAQADYLYLVSQKMIIMSKTFNGSGWSWTMAFENNPIMRQ